MFFVIMSYFKHFIIWKDIHISYEAVIDENVNNAWAIDILINVEGCCKQDNAGKDSRVYSL